MISEFTNDSQVFSDSLHKLDTICTVEIFVQPIAGPDILYERRGRVSIIHLEIVSSLGKRFTSADMRRMCLSRHEVSEIEELCKRRSNLLASIFFPDTPANKVVLRPGVRFIDPETNELHVTFFLVKPLPDD